MENGPETPDSKAETAQESETVEPTVLAERVRKMVSTLFRLETSGLENLAELPPGKRVIFLTTHMSDYDVPITIAALAEKFPRLKVAEDSTHEEFAKNPGGYLGRQLTGAKDSFSVEYSSGESGNKAVFNPENFEGMKKSLEEGNTMVIAAYYDTSYQGKTWRLPEKGGNGGVYLGQITPDSVLIPVAIDIKSKKHFGMGDPGIGQIIKQMRPHVEVHIGKPIIPVRIEGVDRFKEILSKRKSGEKMTDEDRADFSRIHDALKNESDKVMRSVSDMLPPEKRHEANIGTE